MALGDLAQAQADNQSGTASSLAATFSSTPTAGNLLYAVVVVASPDRSISSAPSGWNAGPTDNGGSMSSFVYWKKSAGNESGSQSWSWSGGSGTCRLTMVEIDATGVSLDALDASNETTTYVGSSTTSLSSGAATNSQATALAVAGFSFDYPSGGWDTGRSYTNSFVEKAGGAAAGSVGVWIATKALSATGSQSTTLSTTDSGGRAYGSILIFSAAASGSTGTLAATESGADTAALAGDVLIDGSLAATESGSDVAALIGVALVSGTLAATETGDDAAVIAGSVLAQGTLAATESGSDVAAIEGVTVNVATGSLAATESGSDTAEIVGVVLAQGTLAANDSGEDTAEITGVALVSGTLDATEAGSDTAVIAAVALVQGSLDATESGSDAAAIEGSLAVISTGSLAATESGADTAEIAGVALVSGALAATESANDSAAVSGVVLVTGALDATEPGQDTAAISSAPPVTTAYPGPAGKSRGKRRRVVIRERVYEVSERDIPALIEAELLDRAPPVTAEVVAGPKPPRKRRRKAAEPVKTVEQVREVVQQIKARIEPDNAWLLQALETVAFRVLERLQDEEDSLMLLLAA